MSWKNKLQEIYQKQKLDLPTYEHIRDPQSPDHCPMWRSIVTCADGIIAGTEKYYKKKSIADAEAAKEAYKMLGFRPQEKPRDMEVNSLDTIIRLCAKTKITILVDLENSPQILEENLSFPNATILGFVGHCHPIAEKFINIHKYIVKSSVKDAVDHTITFVAGYVASLLGERYEKSTTELRTFVILSRDHFAEVTKTLLESQNFLAYHVTSVRDLISTIKNLSDE